MARRPANPVELARLTEVFRPHGARDPESWARSELKEGIPQLAVFCCAKALWDGVVDEGDTTWIHQEINWARSRRGDPCTQTGAALEEMLAKGVSRQAITDLVRVFQYEVLYHACSILDGSRTVDLPVNNWTLHQVDEDGRPVAIIQGLHEVLLGMDPRAERCGQGGPPNRALRPTARACSFLELIVSAVPSLAEDSSVAI
jgi:hypothetical protein